MLSITKLILFSGWTIVAGTTFNWKHIYTKMGYKETLADHSELGLANFSQIQYVYGAITLKHDFDNSYYVRYMLRQRIQPSQKFDTISDIPDRTLPFYEFIEKFLRKYFLPLTRHHNDFPPRGPSVFPIKEGTYHVFKVKNFTQLIAPSDLAPREYEVDVTYIKDGFDIGGFGGQFYAFDTEPLE